MAGALVPTIPSTNPNPIVRLQTRFRDMQSGVRMWLARQPAPVEAAVVTAAGAAKGAAIGGLMGTVAPDAPPAALSSLRPSPKALLGGPLMQARNFAVMSGLNQGISCVMKRIRGVEDFQSRMVAAFGSGAIFSLISGTGGSNQMVDALKFGFFSAIIQGGMLKLSGKFSQPDLLYSQTRSMLGSIGLERYEKNFKKGLLTDSTMHLLTDSALKDANIPPGPRLLILNHVHRKLT
ncbi:hypothetical protein J5N97_007045 [Dioscorea zingiberensis]|uniref:SAM domain-containing protein n=1 Tax=Dioscorea zingiberensis TaxID=325984 RepID=A0A9D5DCI5_9LILI|nr:hypothetical protein J5N97_007045 [Dioscorea zingiberensis]